MTNYVLIDLEIVQPKNIGVLGGHDFKVIVFVDVFSAPFIEC